MEYDITERTVDIRTSTTIMPERGYGAWLASNEGSTNVRVNGFTLAPNQALSMLNAVPAGSQWKSPIKIEVPSFGVVRLMRLQYVARK